ncbi:Protein PHYTOCHROME KINASE SUBSTRATE 4 [Forsythia ovata]|uniref:Protein PHYTOCHROME KINASE SUBSTRATE 4 n=1 Tax=Forsythia ovata TaxID=205694 RepID=A0ABD1SN80_9LAMI
MDSPTIIKTLKYNPPQQPMFSVVDTSLHYRSFVQENTYTDASFSSYLKPKEPKQNSPENDTEISIFDAQKYFSESNDPKDSKRPSTGNQKDVSEPSDAVSVPRLSSVSSVDGYGRNFRTRSFHATPTASSEASWNSQTGLLANPPGSIAVNLRNFPPDHGQKRSSNAKKWIFGRKCCCSGKKCVQVKGERSDSERDMYANRESHKSKESMADKARNMSLKNSVPNEMRGMQQKVTSNPPRISSENHFASTAAFPQRLSTSGRPFGDGTGGFSFPILSPSSPATKPTLKGISPKPISPLEDPPRDSLEVFQPTRKSNSRTPMDPQRGLIGGFAMPGSPVSRVAATDDDVGSDASSDLFEIESFSTQTTSYPMYRRRDSLDDNPTFNARRFASPNGTESTFYGRRSLDEPRTPSIAATECYAPSEVSVDWSVTTAEGFDRASVTNFSISASEIGNVAFLRQRLEEKNGEAACSHGAGSNDGGKRKGNGLLSCRHEKAVSVGPQPVRLMPEGPPVPLISTTGHMNGRPQRANKPPLASSYSAGLSLAFAA